MISRLQSVTDGKLRVFSHIDWYLLSAAVTIALLGLVTMHSFSGQNAFFERQVVWIGIAVLVFFATSIPEYRFLQRTPVVVALYIGVIFFLGLVFFFVTIGIFPTGLRKRHNHRFYLDGRGFGRRYLMETPRYAPCYCYACLRRSVAVWSATLSKISRSDLPASSDRHSRGGI